MEIPWQKERQRERLRDLQSNLVNMKSMGLSKKVHIKRNFTLTVARCMGAIIRGDFKVVHIKRYFALNVFILTRFHCKLCSNYDTLWNC